MVSGEKNFLARQSDTYFLTDLEINSVGLFHLMPADDVRPRRRNKPLSRSLASGRQERRLKGRSFCLETVEELSIEIGLMFHLKLITSTVFIEMMSKETNKYVDQILGNAKICQLKKILAVCNALHAVESNMFSSNSMAPYLRALSELVA